MTVDQLLAQMRVGDVIQTIAVVIALAASVIALFVSWRDRVNARKIAAEDRRASLEQAKLLFDLETLQRLLENRNRGGSTDAQESARMGAEALTLVGLLGQDLLPEQWGRTVERDDDGLRELMVDDDFPEWKKDAIEAQLAVNATTRRIRELLKRD